MNNFTPASALMGGVLIGLSAAGMLLWLGRIAGISGILSQAFLSAKGRVGHLLFLLGLIISGLIARSLGLEKTIVIEATSQQLILAGLLVGFGTRLGSGCTSGHGICGLARLSKRSIAATLIFMATAIATVWIKKHLGGS